MYNSGGWVVDTEVPKTTQGAAILLIDEECNVTSLRMYNQAESQGDYRVYLSTQHSAPENQLHARLAHELRFDADPWTEFSATVADEVTLRHRLLPQIIKRGLTLTQG